ncbi:MAG: hypothetical protein C4302_01795 [Thermus sp.]
MRTAQSPLGLLWRFGLRATGLALLANLLLYGLARLLGVPFEVSPPGQGTQEVGWANVALLTVLPMLLGLALYAPLRQRTPKAFPLFQGLALLVFLLLAFAPFAATEEGSTRLALSLLHIPPVAAFLWTLHRVEKALG